ncbi:hypothetical protein [Serratia marcescens]|uniref:Uncharacterized protein n=1 Tax=Serratia marcescens TaxID=615 RepID=A0A9X8YMJ3_SERMA|nr:hypothetical protein [Serratia marcescens]MBS3894610.1 hypothetical protein [Serratia marcescens]
MPDIRELPETLAKMRKQIPFATAQALTSVARQIAAAEKVGIQRTFANPTPFTFNSVKSRGARKDNLVATVSIMDTAAEYLDPYEFGGVHKLNGKALLNPKNIKLNKYGNLPRNKMAQLKAKDDVFVGEVGKARGVFKRYRYKKVKKRAKRSANGTRRERVKQRKPKLLIQYGDALPVKQHLNYFDRANKMAAALMPSALSKAMAEALRTAK